jgi:hypothetical protein
MNEKDDTTRAGLFPEGVSDLRGLLNEGFEVKLHLLKHYAELARLLADEILNEYLKDLEDEDVVDEDGPTQYSKKVVEPEPPVDIKISEAESEANIEKSSVSLRLKITLENISNKQVNNIRTKCILRDEKNSKLSTFSNTMKVHLPVALDPGKKKQIVFNVQKLPLAPGSYSFNIDARIDV